MDIAKPAAAAPTVGPAAPASAVGGTRETKAARAFEAVFLGQMTQLMMNTAESDGPFSGGHGEEMFRGVLGEKLGTAIAEKGGIGLAPRVLDEIIRLQGGRPVSIDLLEAVTSLGAIIDEENTLLASPANPGSLATLVAAKLRLVGLIEREGVQMRTAAWITELAPDARIELAETIDRLRKKLELNSELIRRRVALCDDLMGVIATEARRASGGGSMVYGARGRLARHTGATPISINNTL